MALGLPPRNDVCENMRRIISDRDDEPQDIALVENGTIHPARLHASGNLGHPAFGNDVPPCCPALPWSMHSTILSRSAESGTTVPGNEIALLPVTSPEQCATGKRKRLPSQSRPQKRKRKRQYLGQEDSLQVDVELRCEIVQSLKGSDLFQVQTICDLYLATASADSMVQLRDMVANERSSEKWRASYESPSIVNTVCVLDTLDLLQQSATFLRRILLLRLADHRDRLMEELQKHGRSSSNSAQTSLGGKMVSIVLDTLIVQCYPHIKGPLREGDIREWRETHVVERKALKNRLAVARNWLQAVKRFKLGIIALVPTGGVFQIQNQRYWNPSES